MLKHFIVRYLAVMASLSLIVSSIVAVPQMASAGQNDYPNGDCDSNAVMRCGVRNLSSLKKKCEQNQNGDVKKVMRHFGINNCDSDLDGMVMGRVTKTGNVYVGSEKVATDAVTVGRHDMPGSAKISGMNFYKRKPSVSFRSSSIDALVKMDSNGQFEHAVIMSCGNPVKAKAVKKKTHDVGVVRCDSLTASQLSDNRFRFDAELSGNDNVEVKSYTYDLGDGNTEVRESSKMSNYVRHTYEEPGTYEIKVTIDAQSQRKNGSMVDVTKECATEITIEEEEEEPQEEPEVVEGDFSCESLSATLVSDYTYNFEAISQTDNADIESYEFDFGDGQSETVEASGISAEIQHTYDQPGEYDAQVTVTANVQDSTGTHAEVSTCSTSVSIEEEEEEPQEEPEGEKSIAIEKQVRVEGSNEWADVSITADPGQVLEYRIVVTNTGDEVLENVYIHDSLPSDVDYDLTDALEGSSELNGKLVGDLAGQGITISTMQPNEELEIRFSVTVQDDADACDIAMVNTARANAADVDEVEDDASVTVCQPVTDTPVEEEPEDEISVVEEEPQVLATTDEKPAGKGMLPATGAAGAIGLFSASSALGLAAYKLKEFFLLVIR